MSAKSKIIHIFSFIIFAFFCYKFCVFLKYNTNEQNINRIWLNEEHTAYHYNDTLEFNGSKYLKVYDKDNCGPYGNPYLIEVK